MTKIAEASHRLLKYMLIPVTASLLVGCALTPPEAKGEKQRAAEAGTPYQLDREIRIAGTFPTEPTWQEVLQRAFLVNGELEAAYWDWRAALENVDMAGAYPNSDVQVGYSYMFSGGRMKSWDRSTLSAGFDPSVPLRWPQKVQQAAKVALAQAQTAGAGFANAKFTLQQKVLTAYLNYALAAEKIRIQRDNVSLLELLVNQAGDRVKTGGAQQDLLKAQMQHRLARNDLANMESELAQMRAMLNGMLMRPAEAALAPPAQLPAVRWAPSDDQALIAVAVDKNPELAGLAAEIRGRGDALTLARMAYIPDVQPTFSLTGNISQSLGAMVMLPTTLPMIQGQINQAQAMLSSSRAMERQTRADRAASFVAALYALRNAERAGALLSDTVLPLTRQVLASSREAYSAGQISFVELIDSQRALLDVRQIIAEVRIERERRLVQIEALAGVDVETLAPAGATTMPAVPATAPNSLEHHHGE
jgi:outer membrane protein TolC